MGRFGDEILSRLNTIVRERKALGGPSQRRLANMVGCSSAHMTHLLTGRSPLTLDWLEKICLALKIDPSRLLDDRRRPLASSVYDIFDGPDAVLHERFQDLLEGGLYGEAAAWIEAAERMLKLCRSHLEQLVLAAGAEEGVLWRRRGNSLKAVCSTLTASRLQHLNINPNKDAWQRFSLGEFELWLKSPGKQSLESQSELFLGLLRDLVQRFLPQ